MKKVAKVATPALSPPLFPCLVSLSLSLAPRGLSAPLLTLLNATTLQAEWLPPSRPNGQLLSYRLTVSGPSTFLSIDRGLSLSATVHSLQPFTQYEAFVTVFNTEGSVDSAVENITTGETGEL